MVQCTSAARKRPKARPAIFIKSLDLTCFGAHTSKNSFFYSSHDPKDLLHMPPLRRAVFLDRDGVLVDDQGFLVRAEQICLLEGRARGA